MRHPDDVLDSDAAAVVVADAERAIPAGTTVLRAVEERLARAGGSRSRRGRRRLARRPALLALAAAILVAALAASPQAQAATGSISGWLLRAAGGSPADERQIEQPDGVISATSAGYTVTLTGAYGNQFRTVLFFRTSPNAVVAATQVTDETGHVLGGGGGAGELDGSAFEFDPLAPGRHMLTVHISALMLQGSVAQPAPGPPPAPPGRPLMGEWTLRFPLDVATAAAVVTIPASGDLGSVHVAVSAVVSSGGSLFMRVETTGATIDDLQGESQGGAFKGPGALQFEVFDAGGHQVPLILASGGAAGKGSTDIRTVTWTLYAKEHSGGAYRLVVTLEGKRFESRFTIR
jgi:hypothetical protein